MGFDDGECVGGEEDGSMSIGFKVDSAIVSLSFMMEILDSCWCAGNGDFLKSAQHKVDYTNTFVRYEVEFPLA